MKDFRRMQGAVVADGVKMIEGDDKVREEKCMAEIQRVCDRYDCMMLPEVTIGGEKGIVANIRFKAKPRGRNMAGPVVVPQ